MLLNDRFYFFSSSFDGEHGNYPNFLSAYGSRMLNPNSVSSGRSSRNPRSSKRSSVPSVILIRDNALD